METKQSFLEKKADELRLLTLDMIHEAGSGHPGGALSIAEIMAVLYYDELRLDPAKPDWPDRDRFILSKGHVCPIWYAALADRGFFPKEELKTLRLLNSHLQGHPDMKKVRGLDMTSGSLGNGLGHGIGMALAAKLNRQDYRVYVVLGDGELQEGSVWEAAMFAGNHGLDNLTAIIDKNDLQVDGWVSEINSVDPLDSKWRAFGWNTMVIDGHSVPQIQAALALAREHKGGPTCIICRTVKGKGVPYMENVCKWHGQAPNDEEYRIAVESIGGAL